MNSEWALIEKDKYDDLDRIFLSKMPSYYRNSNLTALLCLVYHAGQDSLIPCFYPSLFCDNRITNPEADTLMLQRIRLEDIGTHDDQYRQCVIRFLQDRARSRRYAIGVDAYTKAALSFIEKLASRPCTAWRNNSDLHEEQCFFDQLILENGIWRFSPHPDGPAECGHPAIVKYDSPAVLCFVYLGYLLFFLPRSGESSLLIQHCRQQAFLSARMVTSLPTRTALVREAMRVYLERVEPTSYT